MSWEPETPPGTAMYLLRMVRANNTLYAIALSDKLPEDSDDDLQVLSSNPDSDLVFFAVEKEPVTMSIADERLQAPDPLDGLKQLATNPGQTTFYFW